MCFRIKAGLKNETNKVRSYEKSIPMLTSTTNVMETGG